MRLRLAPSGAAIVRSSDVATLDRFAHRSNGTGTHAIHGRHQLCSNNDLLIQAMVAVLAEHHRDVADFLSLEGGKGREVSRAAERPQWHT